MCMVYVNMYVHMHCPGPYVEVRGGHRWFYYILLHFMLRLQGLVKPEVRVANISVHSVTAPTLLRLQTCKGHTWLYT